LSDYEGREWLTSAMAQEQQRSKAGLLNVLVLGFSCAASGRGRKDCDVRVDLAGGRRQGE
jgi:hypothetical protein